MWIVNVMDSTPRLLYGYCTGDTINMPNAFNTALHCDQQMTRSAESVRNDVQQRVVLPIVGISIIKEHCPRYIAIAVH